MQSLDVLAALQAMPDQLSDLAQADLSAANLLPLLTELRKHYTAPIAAAALEQAQLRNKAKTKFSHADQMFFTSDALQQATPEAVAQYRAAYWQAYDRVADLGCSIGGDAIVTGQDRHVVGIDRDPIRLQIAHHNSTIYNADVDFIQADLTKPLPFTNIHAAFFDPARRNNGKRIFSVHDYLPPLDIVQQWVFKAVLVKLSPGVKLEELTQFKGGVEFISEHGELKEALLHLGDFAFNGFKATLLPQELSLFTRGDELLPVTKEPLTYLYEPDPAIIRAGAFVELCNMLQWDAFLLDDQIAYLTSDQWVESPWLRAWRIDDWMPFNLKRLKQTLVQHHVGNITVKKRGNPITPEALQQKLKLKKGSEHAIVTLTRLQNQPIVIISYGDQPISVT